MWGGAVGYFGYDVVRQVEHLPDEPEDDLGLPDGLFMFTDVVLAIDNLLGRAMAIATVEVEGALDDDELRLGAINGPGTPFWGVRRPRHGASMGTGLSCGRQAKGGRRSSPTTH